MHIHGFLLIFILAVCCQTLLAEDESVPANESAQPTATDARNFQSAAELVQHIEDRISAYFIEIGAAIQDSELQASLAAADINVLSALESQLQELLSDSIRVRLYPVGLEEVDSQSAPACGFACISIATSSYEAPPLAEALLYNTSDANITLARAVFSESGQAIGVVVVHYPYELITESVRRLRDIGLYTQFQQSVSDKSTVIQEHGDIQVKEGSATEIIHIKGTRWNIAVWTPGGVEVEEYEQSSAGWFKIISGIIILIAGIVLLYKKRHLVLPQKSVAPVTEEPVNVSAPEESTTLIMGGGATEVDISQYLKNNDANIRKPK